jgi:hypothetical protein
MKLALSFLLIILSICGNAQNFNLQWSPLLEFDKSDQIERITAHSATHFYLLKYRFPSQDLAPIVYLEKYNRNSLDLEESNKLAVPKNAESNQVFEDLIYVKEKLLLFTSTFDKVLKNNTAYVQEINDKGVNIKRQIVIDQIEASQLKNLGNYKIKLANDSNHILIFRQNPLNREGKNTVSIKLYDLAFNLVWAKVLPLPGNSPYFEIENLFIDSLFQVYFLQKTPIEKANLRNQEGYSYSLFRYKPKDDVLQEFSIQLPQKQITAALVIQKNEKILVGGLFSESKNAMSEQEVRVGINSRTEFKTGIKAKGIFYFIINPNDKSPEAFKILNFDSSLTSRYIQNDKLLEGEELTSFQLKNIWFDRDLSSVSFAAEQYLYETVCNIDPRTGIQNCNDFYYYNDVFVIKNNVNSNEMKVNFISKSQESINESGSFSSFIMFGKTPGKLYFIFNDNPKNLDLKTSKNKAMTNIRKSIPVIESIDENETQTKTILSSNQAEFVIRPDFQYSLNDTEKLILIQKGKNYKFGKINF